MCLGSNFIDCRCTAPQSFPDCQIYYFYSNSSIFLFPLPPRRPFAELQHTPWLRMKAPHIPPCYLPPLPPTSTHLTKTLNLHFFFSFQMILPILLSMCDCFFSSVSKSFLTESTQCQHFSCSLGAASPYLLLCLYLEVFWCLLPAIM
jgi:hypothetical protein